MTIYRALLAISTTILIKKVLKTSQLPSIASLLIVMYLFCKSAHKSETFLHTPEMSILIIIHHIITNHTKSPMSFWTFINKISLKITAIWNHLFSYSTKFMTDLATLEVWNVYTDSINSPSVMAGALYLKYWKLKKNNNLNWQNFEHSVKWYLPKIYSQWPRVPSNFHGADTTILIRLCSLLSDDFAASKLLLVSMSSNWKIYWCPCSRSSWTLKWFLLEVVL